MRSVSLPLRGKLVLLAQAEPFQSTYIAGALASAGATLLGPARTLAELTSLLGNLREVPNAAVIDVALLDAASTSLINQMRARGMAVVSTSSGARADGADFVAPFASFQIAEALEAQLMQC